MPSIFSKSPTRSRNSSVGAADPEVGVNDMNVPPNSEQDFSGSVPGTDGTAEGNSPSNDQGDDSPPFSNDGPGYSPQTFDWLRRTSEKVQACEMFPNGSLYLDSLSKLYGQSELTDDEVVDIEHVCQKYVLNETTQREEYRDYVSKEMQAYRYDIQRENEEKAKSLILGSRRDRLFHSIQDEADLLPPTNFSVVYQLGGLDGFAKIEKAFKNPSGKLFTGDKTYPIEVYLRRMTSIQNSVGLTEDLFIQVLLSTTSGQPHNTIQAHHLCGKSVASIYHTLAKIFDMRISAAEAKEKLFKYRAQRFKSLHHVLDDIMVLTTRACKDFPSNGRSHQFDSMAYEALLSALPSKSNERTRELYAEVCSAIERTPSFEEVCLAMEKYDQLYKLDIAENGVDQVPDATIYKDNKHYKSEVFKSGEFSGKNGLRFNRPKQRVNQVKTENHAPKVAVTRSRSVKRVPQGFDKPPGQGQQPPKEHDYPSIPMDFVPQKSNSKRRSKSKIRHVNSIQGDGQFGGQQPSPRYNNQNGGRYPPNYQNQGNRTYQQNYQRGFVSNDRYKSNTFNGGNSRNHSYGGNYHNNRSQSQNQNRFKKCTVCGVSGHMADVCRASFTDSGQHIAQTPTTAACTVCKKEFGLDLLHAPSICPWRKSAIYLYELGTINPVGPYKARFEQRQQ